jgi:hypothetical protein
MPLKYASDTLQEMTDAELERLSYNLRVAYANQINSDGNGSISVGISYTNIGSAINTRSARAVNSFTTAEYTAAGNSYPAYPSGTARNDFTYNYQQLQTVPSFPSDATLKTSGYANYNVLRAGPVVISENIQPAGDAGTIQAEIINDCITEMQTGDEVGTYRVATTTPTDGGAGTWTNKGTFFDDDRYPLPPRDDGYITLLYLKRSLDTLPGSSVLPLGLTSDGNLKQRAIGENDDLIQNVLLPILTRKISDGALVYNVDEFPYTGQPASSINRGSAVDSRYIGQDFTQYNGIFSSSPLPGDDPYPISSTKRYHSLVTPAGGPGNFIANVKTYRLYLEVE